MNRVAHQAKAHGLAIGDQRREFFGLESLQAAPESEVRRVWDLCLHRDQVLDFPFRSGAPSLQQMLALE
jgi:hypothetical protein